MPGESKGSRPFHGQHIQGTTKNLRWLKTLEKVGRKKYNTEGDKNEAEAVNQSTERRQLLAMALTEG